MSDKRPVHRFLMETCSQHLHRVENMRRRRELLEREAAKPPVMRFGSIDKSSRSVSPQPHAVLSASMPAKKPRSPLPSNPVSCSQPNNLERTPCPQIKSGLISHSLSGKSSVQRSKSCPNGLAESKRVMPLMPTGQAEKTTGTTRPLEKRSRSTSQTGLCAKFSRTSRPGANFCSGRRDRMVPFMCHGSPTRRDSLPRKKSNSRTPTPPSLLRNTDGEEAGQNTAEVLPSTLRAEEKEDVKTSFAVSPFALPSTTTNQKREELREIPPREEDEEAVIFRISEFRLPRTPQRRSSGVMSFHIQNQASATRANNNANSGAEEEEVRKKRTVEEIVETTLQSNSKAVDEGYKTKEELKVATHDENEKIILPLVSCLLESLGENPVVEHNTTTAPSMLSFQGCECSSTTTDTCENVSNEEAEEAEEDCEIRQLSFTSYDDHEKGAMKATGSAECTQQELTTLVSSLQPENDGCSQLFYECISAPLTPELQLPETFRQLEATRDELATSFLNNHQRVPPRRVAQRRDAEGRGSLVLVTGELPVAHTPSIQEPRSPPPSDVPKRHSPSPNPVLKTSCSQGLPSPPAKTALAALSFGGSSIPRPVTLHSQVSFSQNTEENYGVKCDAGVVMAESYAFREKGLGVGDEVVCLQEGLDEKGEMLATPQTAGERQIDCCSLGVCERAGRNTATERTPQTPSQHRGSFQLSEVLTDASSASQRVATRERRHYYDYTYWEAYVRDATKKSARKRLRKANKKTKKTVICDVGAESRTQAGNKDVVGVRDRFAREVGLEVSTKRITATGTNTQLSKALSGTFANSSQLRSKATCSKKKANFRALLRKAISRKNRERIVRKSRLATQRQNKRPH